MSAIEPGDFCRLARAHLDDWVPSGADHAAVAVLLSHFARSGPAEPLFLESLRALARDPNNGSLAAAAAPGRSSSGRGGTQGRRGAEAIKAPRVGHGLPGTGACGGSAEGRRG